MSNAICVCVCVVCVCVCVLQHRANHHSPPPPPHKVSDLSTDAILTITAWVKGGTFCVVCCVLCAVCCVLCVVCCVLCAVCCVLCASSCSLTTHTHHTSGSASIGQVHRARLRDGTEVAVKVQYPHSLRLFTGDMRTIRAFMEVAAPEQVITLSEMESMFADEVCA